MEVVDRHPEIVHDQRRNGVDLDIFVAESRDQSTTSPKPAVVGRLDSLPRCRRELVRLYREARRGVLATQDATRLAHIVGLVGRMIADSGLEQLEQRIASLEQLKARK
jgi:hypothetical protein